MDRFTLAIIIESIGITVLIIGLVFKFPSIADVLVIAGAILIALGSLLFFKVFPRRAKA